MKICGLQKTTLLDFPGKVAATVFLSGCNFRCPFCHNTDLVMGSAEELMTTEELLVFLRKRRGVLEGVCITGGEPTLQPEALEELAARIKALGYEIKLDTNGYRPKVLKNMCEKKLADYVAMDIKTGRDHYPLASGKTDIFIENITESIGYLMSGTIPYEFRTTVVRGLHNAEDFEDIAQWIGGCQRYFLQGFVDSGNVLKSGFSAFKRAELEVFLKIVQKTIPQAEIRGVDY